MPIATIHNARDFIEILISGVSVMGGSMALLSGLEAARKVFSRSAPEEVAIRINQGLAYGFTFGLPASILVCILLV